MERGIRPIWGTLGVLRLTPFYYQLWKPRYLVEIYLDSNRPVSRWLTPSIFVTSAVELLLPKSEDGQVRDVDA